MIRGKGNLLYKLDIENPTDKDQEFELFRFSRTGRTLVTDRFEFDTPFIQYYQEGDEFVINLKSGESKSFSLTQETVNTSIPELLTDLGYGTWGLRVTAALNTFYANSSFEIESFEINLFPYLVYGSDSELIVGSENELIY